MELTEDLLKNMEKIHALYTKHFLPYEYKLVLIVNTMI